MCGTVNKGGGEKDRKGERGGVGRAKRLKSSNCAISEFTVLQLQSRH